MTIEELEPFILEFNHLPEIPSEQEILENGFDIVANYISLLKQVEILSLQIIKLNNELQQLRQK